MLRFDCAVLVSGWNKVQQLEEKDSTLTFAGSFRAFFFVTMLSQRENIYVEEDQICETDACKETADGLISNIDPTTDPCVDFYQYACGGWIEKNPIPEGRQSYMIYDIRKEEVKNIIADLIREKAFNVTEPKAVQNVGKFYRSCMNRDAREARGLEPLAKLLEELGGWPMLGQDKWSKADYTWYRHAAEANRRLLLDLFIEFDLKPNLIDNEYYILYMSRGSYIFDEFYDYIFSNESASQVVYKYIADCARMMGSSLDEDTLMKDAADLLEFEYNLYQVGTGNVTDSDELEFDFSFLNENVKSTPFLYKDFVNRFLKSDVPVEDDTRVYIFDLPYILELPVFMASVSPRIVANYISFHAVYFYSDYLTKELQDATQYFDKEMGSVYNTTEEKFCLKAVKILMSDAVGRLYVDHHFPALMRYHITKMVDMIRLAYSSTLDQNLWMDKQTLLYSLVKLQSIQSMIGHEGWINNNALLDKYYEKVLDFNEEDFFEASINLASIINDEKYSRWNKTATRNDSDSISPFTVNAFYSPRSNYMTLPAGIFGYPFYKYNRIDSINYGGIGTVIGHEISHAFDTSGRYFDHRGNYRNWWTHKTLDKFLSKARCFAEQYENFVDPLSPFKVDGNLTLGENIADNGAVRNAFKAFRLHLALSGEDLTYRKKLPGLSASPEQLFFLGYASVWCSNMTDDYIRGFRIYDEHSPNKLRVNVPLANFKEFARAYKCNPGTPMNPKNKCVLW
ncbi:neprilysin-1-like [Stegodyphus dumicola]|uniref:neprilysin-1-like n=1 Tax=Stegodyphus dumicola TaxID=202533 RepID=UPI0015AE7DD9|nr:neprilysin-1-like [Stegodyphus dumicola]